MLLRHFFLSYSHRDKDLVERLQNDLARAGIPVWKDDWNIQPGTPDYEKAIRQALKEAYAVLLLASPHAAGSEFVPDEISVAKTHERRVIPVWIAGENYIDCVPLGMGKSQYLDLRGKSYRHGLELLISQSQQLIAEQTPKHQLVQSVYKNNIKVPNHLTAVFLYTPFSPTVEIYPDFGAYGIPDIQNDDAVVVNPGAFPNLKALLDELYIHYLRERFRPLTYGQDWLLQRHLVAYPQLVVPLSWFTAKGCEPISSIEPTWAEQMSLKDCGLEPGTSWEIAALEKPDQRGSVIKSDTLCLLCRDKGIIDAVVSDDLGKSLYYLKKDLKVAELDSVNLRKFPNIAIIKAPHYVKDEKARVLTQK